MADLNLKTWTSRAKQHALQMEPFTDAFIKRRQSGETHPVHDFLFTYYKCSPQKLKQWVPSFEENLIITSEIKQDYPWFNDYWFCLETESSSTAILRYNRERLHKNVFGLATFVADLCSNILQRAPRFGCFGLHEWAMVYKLPVESIRHHGYRLRLPPDQLATFVESQTICCSHYDAYRFFTKEAHHLNILDPQLETRLQMEQSGCLHANMDLYKWATKLWPWVGSDFLAKAFLLALEGRELDMRASPYDLREHGYEPVCIETEDGRNQYQREQQRFSERSVSLREELLAFCKRLISTQ